MRKRLMSILLCLVMLFSLVPGAAVPVHAFWEDYDNGQDCEYCDHYHWAENCCDGCGFCTVDCNSDCFAEFHCNDCGECLFNTPFWCDQCYKCADCMEEKHCSTCGKCYIGEDDQLCGECYKGPCCSITICDSCGFCDDCANDDSDRCEDGCDQRCKDCCLDAVRAMGCDHDDWCFSDSNFEDHLKAEHSGAGHKHIASSSWSADGTQHWNPCRYCDEKMNPAGHEFDAKGVCKVCGHISGSSIVITRQPKGVKCKTSIYDDYNEEPENGLLYYENNPVTFSVTAKSLRGDGLTYQWYRKNNEIPTAAHRKLEEWPNHIEGVNTPTLRLSVSTQACQEDYSYYCVIGRKGDPSDTMKTAEAKLTATHAFSYQQAGEPVYTDDGKRTPEYKVTWVDKDGNTQKTTVGSVRKSDGHKLKCLFEESAIYEAHYMTTGSKERIFPHTFKLEKSYDAVGGGRVDMLVCTVCDYFVFVKSHVHDYGWNWDYTGFGSIYEYTFNIGGSTKTVEQLILESDNAHPEKCKVPGCEEFIMVPHSWGYWNVVLCPDTTGNEGGMEAECSICEYKETKKIDGDWTKDTALVTVKNGRATRMIVEPGDKIKLYPEERTGQKAIGWKVEYLRQYNDGPYVSKQWNYSQAESLFKLVTNGSALEWGCTIPAFSAMSAPGGGQFFFEPVYSGCTHSGGTTLLNAKPQVCDRKGYTGDTACADCGKVIKPGSDIYPPANAGHTGKLEPLYYYGTNNSATTDASHGGKRYNAKSGDCKHRAYEGDYRCTACGGTVKGEIGDFRHSGPLELRDVRAATCTEKGYSGNQYCTACDRIAQKGKSTPSLHEIAGNYQVINAVKPTCTAVGYSGDQQCTRDCGQIFRYGHVIDKSGHDWDDGKPATQGKSEGILYTCRRVGCGETKFVKNPAATEYSVKVSTDGNGTAMADKTSAAAGTVVTLTETPKSGYHFKEWQVITGGVTINDNKFTMPAGNVEIKAIFEKNATPPPAPTYYSITVTSDGNGTAKADKTSAAAGTVVTLSATPKSGYHFKQWQVDKGGVTIEDNKFTMPAGNVEIKAIFEKNATPPPATTEYSVTVSTDGNGTAMADKTSAAAGTVVTLTATPKSGYHFKQWQVVSGNVTIKDNKFTMPAGNVEVKAIFEKDATPPPAPTVNPFVDVPAGSFYYDAVLWAVEKGVTTGTSATTFEPDGSCTRAQAVTFLWRVAGCPAPKSTAMPFTDVKAGSFYYDAVLWAVENGITKGTSETTFEPEGICTRAQIVTLIWRAQKSPAAGTDNPFNDVKAGSFYETAVLWAVKAGVTKGTSAVTFEPEGICTRAQIVTLIWRCMK